MKRRAVHVATAVSELTLIDPADEQATLQHALSSALRSPIRHRPQHTLALA